MAEDAAARASQRGRPSFTTSSRNLHGASSRSAQQKQEELARRVQESRKALGSRSEGILRKSEMDSQSILRRVQSVSQGDEEQQERAAVRIQARARGNAARKHTHSASQGDEEWQERAAVRIQARARGNAARKHARSASQGDEERQERAAVRIQARARGNAARKHARSASQGDEVRQERAAVRIQARARGNAVRKRVHSASQGDEERQERAAVRIQARARGNAARKHTHSASQGDEELSRQRVPSPPAHKAGPAQWVDGIGWVQEAELEVLRDYVQQSAASVQNTSKTSAGDRPSETEPRVGSRQVFCPKTGVLLCEVHYDEHLAPSPAPSPSYSARYGSALPECESISDSIRAWQEHTSLQGGAERGGTQAEALEHRNGEGQQSRLDSAVLTDQGAGPHEVISQFVTSTEAMTVFAHDAADASKYISRGLLKSDSSSCKVCLKKKQGHHGPEFYCVAEADWKCQHCGRVKREHHGVKVYCIHEAEQTCKICAKPRRLHTGAGQYCRYGLRAQDGCSLPCFDPSSTGMHEQMEELEAATARESESQEHEQMEEIEAATARESESQEAGEAPLIENDVLDREDGVVDIGAAGAAREGGVGTEISGDSVASQFATRGNKGSGKDNKKKKVKDANGLDNDLAMLEKHVQHMSPQQLERFNRVRQLMSGGGGESHRSTESELADHRFQSWQLGSVEMLTENHEHMSPQQKQRFEKVLGEIRLKIPPPMCRSNADSSSALCTGSSASSACETTATTPRNQGGHATRSAKDAAKFDIFDAPPDYERDREMHAVYSGLSDVDRLAERYDIRRCLRQSTVESYRDLLRTPELASFRKQAWKEDKEARAEGEEVRERECSGHAAGALQRHFNVVQPRAHSPPWEDPRAHGRAGVGLMALL